MRADQLLVEHGLAASRAQAQRLIAAGTEWQGADGAWRRVGKNGEDLRAGVALRLLDDAERRFVSRGGLKLEGALHASRVTVAQRSCLDVGQSTGGFTDVLLQAGAALVLGVDVGHGQLHPRLRADPRVRVIEGVNARTPDAIKIEANLIDPTLAAAGFDLIVADLSFISLTLVLAPLVSMLAPHGDLLALVKPQFELQPGDIGKGGIVRDERLYLQVEQRLRDACRAAGLQVCAWLDSPIRGGDGNREFFIHARRAS